MSQLPLTGNNRLPGQSRNSPQSGRVDRNSVGYSAGLGRNNKAAVGEVNRRQIGLSEMLGGQARQQYAISQPAYEKGLNFYKNLLGSRASQQQALAPAIRNINEGGVGARSAIRNRMGRSGSRDMMFAEEQRRRQGDINSMLAGAPLIGAAGVERMSNAGLDRSLRASGMSSQALDSVSASLSRERQLEEQQKREKRSRWASIGLGLAKIFAPVVIGAFSAPLAAGMASAGLNSSGQPTNDPSQVSG